jgi:hypothetical protein
MVYYWKARMIKKENSLLIKVLTYCGAFPLIFCAVARLAHFNQGDISVVAQTYGAIIISFLCGIQWSAYLFFPNKCSYYLLISSNVVALLAWASLLATNASVAIILQILCFLYLLTLDLKLRDGGILPEWFYHLRRNVTIIVVVCLSILIFDV